MNLGAGANRPTTPDADRRTTTRHHSDEVSAGAGATARGIAARDRCCDTDAVWSPRSRLGDALREPEREQPLLEPRDRGRLVEQLRALAGRLDRDPGRRVRHAHACLDLVDVLAARAARAHRRDLEVGVVEVGERRVARAVVREERRRLDRDERRHPLRERVERREPHEPVLPLLAR